MDGGRRCLSEVDDSRLILTDVMHQHYSTAENEIGTYGWLRKHTNPIQEPQWFPCLEEIHIFVSLTLQYQKCEGAQFPSRGQQRWQHQH